MNEANRKKIYLNNKELVFNSYKSPTEELLEAFASYKSPMDEFLESFGSKKPITPISKEVRIIKELRKDNENLTKELEHEKIHSDNSNRIIKWMSGQNGSLYKDDVEEEDEE